MKMAVLWDVAPCSPVEVYRRFRGAYCFHNHRDEPLLITEPWRWRRHVYPKCCYLPASLHGVTIQNTIVIFSTVRTSNLIPEDSYLRRSVTSCFFPYRTGSSWRWRSLTTDSRNGRGRRRPLPARFILQPATQDFCTPAAAAVVVNAIRYESIRLILCDTVLPSHAAIRSFVATNGSLCLE
jgi:hypothetical protein